MPIVSRFSYTVPHIAVLFYPVRTSLQSFEACHSEKNEVKVKKQKQKNESYRLFSTKERLFKQNTCTQTKREITFCVIAFSLLSSF